MFWQQHKQQSKPASTKRTSTPARAQKKEAPRKKVKAPKKKRSSRKKASGWLNMRLKEGATAISHLQEQTSTNMRSIRSYVVDVLLGIGLFIILVSIPLLLSLGYAWRGLIQLRNSDFPKAEQMFSQSYEMFQYYRKPAEILGMGAKHATYLNLIQTGVYASRMLIDLEGFAGAMEPITSSIQQSLVNPGDVVGYSSDDLVEHINESVVNLRSAQTWFMLVERTIDAVEVAEIPQSLQAQFLEMKELLWLGAPIVENADGLISNLHDLLGFDGQRRYIILLQNNNELRATGGFIGSYVAMNLSYGVITNFKVDDIYNPDGLLDPYEDPDLSPIIRKYLANEYMPIRDTNWWPEFDQSAAEFVDLYQMATGEVVHGVIGLNLEVVENILAVIGEVTVPQYGETITSENLADQAQVHAEIGFTPGSTQKADFLGALSQVMITELGQLDAAQTQAVLVEVMREVLGKEITIYLSNPILQAIASSMQVTGELIVPEGDYIKVVDSNVGANKVNYWVTRQSNYMVDVDREGSLMGRLQLSWENQANSSTWPGGDYVNYLRVYVPAGVEKINVQPALEEALVIREENYTVISGVVRVPIQTTREIEVSYQLSPDINLISDREYQLVWEPQAGIEDESIKFTLNLPVFLTATDELAWERTLNWPIQIKIPISGT